MTTGLHVEKLKQSTLTGCKFSILIPTWNNLAYLQLCIASIRKNSLFSHQLIVHVNEGKDGTVEWLKTQPDIDFTYSRQNIGVCYGLNIARNLSTTDYIVYMNDDMYACPGWDTALDDEIRRIGHKYFFLSATAIEPETQNPCCIEMDFGRDLDSFKEERLLAEFSLLPMKDWKGATWPPNIVHKDIWDLAGGYSIEFSPGMSSDPDFSMKLWKMGVRLFKGIEKSRVYHFGSVSVKRITKNKGYYAFIAKWGITQNTFSTYFLQRGEPFNGPAGEPQLSASKKLSNIFKQFKAIFYR